MSDVDLHHRADLAPGDEDQISVKVRVLGYLVGLGLAILLTATSFFVAGTDLVWQPSIPVAIIVLESADRIRCGWNSHSASAPPTAESTSCNVSTASNAKRLSSCRSLL